MDLTHLIEHPELMDRETLYELRSFLAVFPYHQPARLLLLQNLYLLHDAAFDEELRRAAIYITDRKVIFNMVEAVHYQLRTKEQQTPETQAHSTEAAGNRTLSLIDNFLDTLPEDQKPDREKGKRKPTPADAAVDYVAYLLEVEEHGEEQEDTPQLRGQTLIDNFIHNSGGKIVLKDEPELLPELEAEPQNDEPGKTPESGYFTETLARIYIKQGRYDKALEIIKQLNLNYPKKNAYFADQIRFLEKLIINNNKINRKK